MPPNERNNYDCEKEATGPLDRKKLISHINQQALDAPDEPELEPFVKGKVRGKKVSDRHIQPTRSNPLIANKL